MTERILITQLGKIGDMILITPAIRAISEKFPAANIDVLAGRRNYSIIENNPRVNRVIVYRKSPKNLLKTFSELRRYRYDYYIDPKDHESFESSMFARIVKADRKIGFNPPGKRIFNIGIPSSLENLETHFVERVMQAVSHTGIKISQKIPRPELFPKDDSEYYTENFLKNIPNDFLTINISASQHDRTLSAGLIDGIIQNSKIDPEQIVINRAPAEESIAEELNRKYDVNIFPSRSMDDVISLIKRSKLLVTPDTSLVHVAAAFDIPLLALYGRSDMNFRKFRPLSSIHKVIKASGPESGINDIPPETIADKLLELMDILGL